MSAAEIWLVDLALTPDRLARCGGILDPEECARCERFLRPSDRARYRASHAALRVVLGEALGVGPAGIALAATATGKPMLAGRSRGALDFNLSHSGQRALIGLARGAAIGIDVEQVRPLDDALRIARAHFAPDEAGALAALPPERVTAAFFGLWTRKEAVVKALGTGLSLPLDRFSVSPPPEAPRVLRGAAAGPWSLAEVDAGPGYAATAAVRAGEARFTVRILPEDWPDRLG